MSTDNGDAHVVSRSSVLQVTLGRDLCLGPRQIKAVSVHVDLSQASISVGLVSPSECTMAQFGCDFTE